jgi:Bacteriocin-protection, YdeI or OmpD-Associated/Domain of unknown function (DUF1905)
MNRLDQDYVFAAQIQKIWIMRCIDVPRDISAAIRKSVGPKALHVPVRGWIEGLPFRNTLVPRGGGSYRMHVHSSIWRKLRIDAGAAVEVSLSLDTEPRQAVLPPDLAAALADTPRALATFNALTVAFRSQIIRYLEAAKRSHTRDKRIQLIVRRMLERAAKSRRKQKPLRNLRKKK